MTLVRVTLALLVLVLLGVLASRLDFGRDLRRLRVKVLSGAPEGNYYALVSRLSATASKSRGTIENVQSAGSVENVQRLIAAEKTCDVQFAIVQDDTTWSFEGSEKLEVIARLSKSESVFFLGKNADSITEFAQLAKLRIGIGPEGSGTARIGRQILQAPDFRELGIVLEPHPIAEQIALAGEGKLDLAMVVIDEDAPLVSTAIRDRGLQMVGFPHADVIARKLRPLRVGRIGAGQYDALKNVPSVDKRVFRIDTLVIGNRCGGRSQTVAFLSALTREFPDLVRHNRESTNDSGLPMSKVARSFYDQNGPDALDEYAPWLVDVMPAGNWAYVIMAASVLFNAMGLGHRFRLWRIDARRVKSEDEIARLFPKGTTLGDIDRMEPGEEPLRPEIREGVRRTIDDLEALAETSRKQSLSILAPMGQEMAYRYQEGVIQRTIAVLRGFLARHQERRASMIPKVSETTDPH